MIPVQPLEGLKTKVSHKGGQPCLCDWSPVKTLDPEVGVSSLGWQHPDILSHIVAGRRSFCPHDSTRRGWLDACTRICSGFCSVLLFLCLISICIFFPVMNQNHKCNSYSEFWVLLMNDQTLNLRLVSKARLVLGTPEPAPPSLGTKKRKWDDVHTTFRISVQQRCATFLFGWAM